MHCMEWIEQDGAASCSNRLSLPPLRFHSCFSHGVGLASATPFPQIHPLHRTRKPRQKRRRLRGSKQRCWLTQAPRKMPRRALPTTSTRAVHTPRGRTMLGARGGEAAVPAGGQRHLEVALSVLAECPWLDCRAGTPSLSPPPSRPRASILAPHGCSKRKGGGAQVLRRHSWRKHWASRHRRWQCGRGGRVRIPWL